MQVAAFALYIRYYSDVDTWAEKEGAVIMGAPMQIAGSVLGLDNGISVIQAEIRKVEMLETYDAKEYPVLFYAVTIDTCYEKLEIFHVADMVSDEAKKLICVGACVYANCVIQGNVALGRYENGAVYDEESCLRLIENAFSLSSFERAEAAFAEGAEYIDGDLSVIRTKDRKATVSAVANILTNAVKKEGALYAYLGRAEKFYGTWDDSFTGKGILVLSHTTPAYFREMLSVRLDGENKIAAVTVKNVGDYDIRIREKRHLPVNEAVCLELVKDALESGDCSRLVNYFSRDIVFTDLTGLKKKGSYEVLDAMAQFLFYQYENGIDINIFPFKIISGDMQGRECPGISLGDFDDCGTLLTVDIEGGAMAAINVMRNDWELAETCVRKKLVPLVTERTPPEWLAFLRDWINDKETDPMAFYLGLASDCAITVDDGKVLETPRGKEDVFKRIKELADAAEGAKIREKTLYAEGCSLTVQADSMWRIRALRVRLLNMV